MARLIDADDLIERIEDVLSRREHRQVEVPSWLQKIIDELPTAYNVEKVVEELEAERHPEICGGWETMRIEKAIDIVRKSGVDNGVCKWKMDYVGASIGCRSDLHHTGYVDYKECPYCGKKIKVVEE